MVESGRKHGPFDFRYPLRRRIASPVWELQRNRDGSGRLEWSIFLARFFAKRRRHDFEALAAYEGYRNALLVARGAGGPVRTVSPSPALVDWESEGGTVEPDFD